MRWKHITISTSKTIILSFLTLILLGSLLLMLPIASRSGSVTDFRDTLFTAVSSVCVTGLVVRDTATHWSTFGQAIILGMIQIGGIGVITFALAIAILSGRKIGLMQRQTMQDAISAPQVGGILHLTIFILRTVIGIELAGAVLLSFSFIPLFGWKRGIWYSIFHSVSAFCNAGFDLMGIQEQFSSLTAFGSQVLVNLTIMILIVVGGIGFITLEDFRRNGIHFHRYRTQSKMILMVTAGLILLPALYFFFLEFQDAPLKERTLMSLFQSVTTRTAGFNTADLTGLHDSGKMLMILLMLVGGSPGSTAGGMKTTTMAVLLFCTIAVFRRQSNIVSFKRRIPDDVIRNAIAIMMMYLMLTFFSGCIISYIEGIPLLDTLFETASAVGTVGLTLGITTKLGQVSRLILIILMFLGRVGGLTFIYATLSGNRKAGKQYPVDKITVG